MLSANRRTCLSSMRPSSARELPMMSLVNMPAIFSFFCSACSAQ
jgi:hypothetical protein